MMKNSLFTRKLLVLVIFFIIGVQGFSQQQTISYENSWGKSGLTILNENSQKLEINFSVDEFELNSVTVENQQMQKINLKGIYLPNDEGKPDLPFFSRYIAIPQGATVSVKLVDKQTEIMEAMEIAPAPRIPKDEEVGPILAKKDQKVYSTNAFFPSQNVRISEPKKIRGLDVVLISLSPFQYNPVTKELKVHRDMKVEITFEGGNGHFGDDRLRSRWWDPIIKDEVINSKEIAKVDYNQKQNRASSTGCEYVIITPNDDFFAKWADSIRLFRLKQGITTQVYKLSDIGGSSTSIIEQFIDSAYNTWDIPPSAVLLMADYGTDPNNSIDSPIYDNYCISDNKYADVDGDHLPDIVFARMTAQNEDQLETMVTKAINYERNPPTNQSFYDHPVTAMGWQTERWFQLCSEIIAGFMENSLGKTVNRENAIYQGNNNGPWSTATNTNTIVNYFGDNGLGYIPDDPSYLNDWGGNATRINNDINSGAFLVQHRDHGGTDGWGEPSYNTSDIDGLTNTDFTYVFSVNCLTGKFNISGTCFAEKFHRVEYGALGIIAATESSYSFVNDTYVWGMYDNMWPEFMPDYGTNPESRGVLPAFGNAAGKYFLQQSNWPSNPGNKEVTYYLFHAHGDAFTDVYYNMPQALDVEHDEVMVSSVDFFTVKANEGSFICLTNGEEIIGTATGTGDYLDIPVIPQEPGAFIDIVITKQNYFRYSTTIMVIPPDGPYCMYAAHEVNDTLGNGNGAPEFDETILLSLKMQNLGTEDGINVNVKLETTDPYIAMIDTVQPYDTIYADSSKWQYLAYKFKVSNGIPDMHNVTFNVIATDENDSTWITRFSMTFMAPKITPLELSVDDSDAGNGNGILDPGEIADIKVKLKNKGHCIAHDVLNDMVAWNNYITVNTGTDTISVLGMLGHTYAVYNVSVSDTAPEGMIAEMHFFSKSAGYTKKKTYFPKIGMFLEDFETGNFNKYDWQQGGNLPWEINNQFPYQGLYQAKSGPIGNGESSELSIEYKVMAEDQIKFYKKVSSEIDFDVFEFFIDDELYSSWSGTNEGWTQQVYDVVPGMHEFKWVYRKDFSGSGGADCAWLDYIELPTMLVTTLFAGPDDESCVNNNYQLMATATNQNSILWLTSGDGTFDDPSLLQPEYTPGTEDINNGNVVLTMTVIDNDGYNYSDDMVLTFTDVSEAPQKPEGPDFVDIFKISETDYTTHSVDNADIYKWSVNPPEAGEIIDNDTAITVYWNTTFMGEVWLKVQGVNNCGNSVSSDSLYIVVDNTVGVLGEVPQEFSLLVAPNPNRGDFNLIINSPDENPVTIRLINNMGNEVYRKENLSGKRINYHINKDLTPGVYLLVATQRDKQYVRKVLVL
jgi:hypothetical protein